MGYPSDVTDDDWLLIEKYFERTNKRGALSIHAKRDIVNAILYVARSGIQWRMLPTDFLPWGTVYDHYRNWCMRGVWQQALDDLTELHRRKQGRDNKPSYGIIDSQSTKTQYASEDRGYDGGKKIKGRKRHIVVDILGNLLHVKVHAANIHDTKAAGDIFDAVSKKHPSIQAFSADAGYRGTAVNHVDNEM